MRARVSQTILNRVTKLDAALREERNRAAYVIALQNGIGSVSASEREQFTRAQRTILSWPRILSCDAWEELAAPLQDKLIQDSFEDRADRAKREPGAVVIGPDPSIVTHRYR